MVKQKKRTGITQSGKNCVIKLRHPRRALDLKAKDLIGSFKKRCLLANHNPEFRCVICTGITLYTFLHSFLSQSESSNFFMYVISIIMWHSHLNDMEIPETKRFIPKGFELGTTLS